MGVLVFEGMKVGILPGDLTISLEESGPNISNAVLSTSYNVIPLWMRSAKDSLEESKSASERLAENWTEGSPDKKNMLIEELSPSMQVIVSCGVVLDALYDMLKPFAKLSEEDIKRWKEKKTGRSKQIAEVIRRSLKLKKQNTKEVKKAVNQIIKFRDVAVHPTLELKNAVAHPEIGVGVDWKFVAYRYSNASRCFETTMQILVLANSTEALDEELKAAFTNIFEALQELGVVRKKT